MFYSIKQLPQITRLMGDLEGNHTPASPQNLSPHFARTNQPTTCLLHGTNCNLFRAVSPECHRGFLQLFLRRDLPPGLHPDPLAESYLSPARQAGHAKKLRHSVHNPGREKAALWVGVWANVCHSETRLRLRGGVKSRSTKSGRPKQFQDR